MKLKRLLITMILAIAVLPAFAQLLPISLEIRGGLNRSEPHVNVDNSDHRFSYRAEAILDIKKGLGFFTRTGITLTEKNVKLTTYDDDEYLDAKITANYIEVPAMVGYKLGIPFIGSVNVAGGMYFGYGIGGKIKYKSSVDLTDEDNNILAPAGDTYKENTFGNKYKRFDTGFGVSAGVEIKRITFNLGYEHGLLNVAKGGGNIKNRSVYATLGVKVL